MTESSTAGSRDYQCRWCLRHSDAGSTSCPSCGAPVDVGAAKTNSGWSRQPPIKDMAKIQFGQSFCQIQGAYVPVADFKLAAGDGVYFSHHLMLWKDDAAAVSVMPMRNGWTRMMAGLPLIMAQAGGPGRIAFSKDKAGELIAIPLDAGQSIDVREHGFFVATSGVGYDWFTPDIWFQTQPGKEVETHYPVGFVMDRFTASDKPGLLLLHGQGNVFVRHLEEGQTILVKPKSLLYKDPSVQMNLHFEHSLQMLQAQMSYSGRQRYGWIRLQGPGRVAIQSEYEPLEDRGTRLVGVSATTTIDDPTLLPRPIKANPVVVLLVFVGMLLIFVFAILSKHKH